MRIAALLAVLLGLSVSAQAEVMGDRDGELRETASGELLAWDEVGQTWRKPVAFWQAFAQRDGIKSWGQSREYPPYDDVRELDVFMVELDSGVCLMQFYHQRWRRANDVRRWSPEFNSLAGCPDVFK
ncbi:hypothetical protein [Aliamphritea spongicola]|uniref:hypothetical protein n=1 Tax=Aliamphritea spongicola TaxID=707589 RepID=UPI00196BAA7E|nr:hypothetical protein [Aliamphritea spongicola]MBN3563061.1 hypothetical protein [Aliamphritea spongicola]